MQKKIPMRQCLGCREMKPKRELVRVVRTPEGEIHIDRKGKMSGRGAYLCHSAQCFLRAVKTKAISRALETEIPQEIYDRLAEEMEAQS